MDAVGGGGEEVDAVPAHLEEEEADDEDDRRLLEAFGVETAVVDVQHIGSHGYRRPSLFGIPAPIGAPCLLCPDRPEEESDDEKARARIDEVVRDIEAVRVFVLLFVEHIDRQQEGCAEHPVGKHVRDHVGDEEGAFEGRHHRLGVDLGLEDIDADKDRRKDGREAEDPAITPTAVNDEPCNDDEERIPEPCLAHSAHRWAFERMPHPCDIHPEDDERQDGDGDGRGKLFLKSQISTQGTDGYGREGEVYEVVPVEEEVHRASFFLS